MNCSGEAVAEYSTQPASSAAKVYEIDPLCDLRWERLVNDHPSGSVFHSSQWLRALKTTYGYEPVVITTCPPGTPLTNGIVFCRVRSWLTGRRLVSLPFSDHCEPLASEATEIDQLLHLTKQYVDVENWKYIEIRPTSYQPTNYSRFRESLMYWGHSLDLSRSEHELFNNFHKNCVQRKIQRAEREQVRYEEGNSEHLLDKFYRLLVVTRRRQFVPPQPLSWFRALIDSFGESLKIRLASKDDSPIASILTLSHKKSLVYKYGCSDARFHRFGGMSLLFWATVQEAKDKGFEELDMGRSNTDNRGLVSFKERWGATPKPLVYWTYPRRRITTIKVCESAIRQCVVPVMSQQILRAAGTLLYRHIG
jgi:hypothetical protein